MKGKRKPLLTVLALILIFAFSGYFFYQYKYNSNSTPPNFDTGLSALQGRATNQFYKFSEDDDFSAPTNLNPVTLQKGLHYYYSRESVSIQDIIDNIKPEGGNRVLIGYYHPKIEGSTLSGFYGYPIGPETISNPSSFVIPANQGIAIYSSKETVVYGLKSEADALEANTSSMYGDTKFINISNNIYPFLENIKNGWVLVPTWSDFTSYINWPDFKVRIKNIYYLNNSGDFVPCGNYRGYLSCTGGQKNFAWIELKEPPVTPLYGSNTSGTTGTTGTTGTGSSGTPTQWR